MQEPIVLKFQATGLGGITADIMQTINRMKQMQTALDGVNRGLTRMKSLDPSASITRAGNAAAISSIQLARYNQQLAITGQLVGGRGNYPSALPMRGLPRQPGGNRKPPPSFSARLGQLVMSSRVNLGSASPLVGNIAKVLGLSLTNPVTAAVLASLGTMGAIAGLGIYAGNSVSSSAGLNLTSSARGMASLNGIAAGLGFDAASGSKAFQSSIQSGAARSFAQRAGVNPLYNEYSGEGGDFSDKMAKFFRYWGDPSKTSRQTAAAAARSVGLENEIGVARDASKSVRDMMFRRNQEYTPQERRIAADAKIYGGIAMDNFTKLLNHLGVAILPTVNDWLEKINKGFDKASEYKPKGTGFGYGMGFNRPENYAGNLNEAAKDLTKSSRELARAAEAFKDGVYGQGSAKAQNAVTPGIRGAVRSGNADAARYYAQQGIPI